MPSPPCWPFRSRPSLAGPFVQKAQPLLSFVAVSRLGITSYQSHVGENYKRLRIGTRFLSVDGALPGPIFVFGHPMAYPFSGRQMAHVTTGSSWEFFTPEQTRDLLETLERERTPYILVGKFDRKLFHLRPEVDRFLSEHYEQLHRDESGLWYRVR